MSRPDEPDPIQQLIRWLFIYLILAILIPVGFLAAGTWIVLTIARRMGFGG